MKHVKPYINEDMLAPIGSLPLAGQAPSGGMDPMQSNIGGGIEDPYAMMGTGRSKKKKKTQADESSKKDKKKEDNNYTKAYSNNKVLPFGEYLDSLA
jgi:hypothetical protein